MISRENDDFSLHLVRNNFTRSSEKKYNKKGVHDDGQLVEEKQ